METRRAKEVISLRGREESPSDAQGLPRKRRLETLWRMDKTEREPKRKEEKGVSFIAKKCSTELE